MGRPPTLPGIWGTLAEAISVSGLAKALGTNPRTLYNWANNKSPMPAIESGKLAEICRELKVQNQLFACIDPVKFVESTPEGWVEWKYDYGERKRYTGFINNLLPINKVIP